LAWIHRSWGHLAAGWPSPYAIGVACTGPPLWCSADDVWLGPQRRDSAHDEWFLCGPLELVTNARERLIANGVGADGIHLELFYGYDTKQAGRQYIPATVTFNLSGAQHTIELAAGDTILESVLQNRDDAPYACMGGACGTCRAKLLDGTVEMDQNFALGKADLDAGYILTCQSHPTSPAVQVDYDA
jgi:ring-1,2-phenylacetyl-CoA epoxidase subunit PaaE